ncbi:MAG: bifunctional folylpolyglutamate synthase/dihydrofolate synthase [Alphaproteobacteria bacterium]
MHKADLHHSNKILQEKLERIFQLRRTRSVVNWDREHYLDLLQYFGNPHEDLPPVIHVAGTNGKGSVVAMLRSVCEAQGLRVHSYTSPHLLHVNERIVLAGEQISDDRLEALIDEALAYIGDTPLSFFEVITAIAFKMFSDVPADVLLLEVGMGGLLDCTNIIERPLVSVINRVSMDHTAFLGDTIDEIAAQKAGIIKLDVPCVLGYQGADGGGEHVVRVVRETAQRVKAPIVIAGQDFSFSVEGDDDKDMIFCCGGDVFVYPLTALQGLHQQNNAALVFATLKQMSAHGIVIHDDAIAQGFKICQWPGRLQRIDTVWPDDVGAHEIWLDCGHNDSAGEALAAQIAHWNESDFRLTYLIIGMITTKDSQRFLHSLQGSLSRIYVVPVPKEPHSQSAQDIADGCKRGMDVTGRAHYTEALLDIIQKAEEPARVLIAGSVYLAGDVLRFIKAGESR